MNELLKVFFEKSKKTANIEHELYHKYSVKNGLRNEDSTGVLVGLTKISDIVGYEKTDGKKIDIDGKLYYRGIDVFEIINSSNNNNDLYEEVCFLILFGYLPSKKEFKDFKKYLASNFTLPNDYLESKILRFPAINLMNKLQQDILSLYSYDSDPDNISVEHKINQGLSLVAKIPSLITYNYQSKMSYFYYKNLFINKPNLKLSYSENILQMLRKNKKFSKKEAQVLDIILVLHADHGGGNNSTFVNVVMSSTGTDIYSSFAGAVGSLKGPKHGGANLEVSKMMSMVINEIGFDSLKIKDVINKILNKNFFDNSGLIYGMGHAVYTLSDPRSVVLKKYAKELAIDKNVLNEFLFYEQFEKIASDIIFEKKGIRCSSNVDFYSGFIYKLLNIPEELYTMLFACSRTIGWLAHNIESQIYSGKIVRPATKFVGEIKNYVDIEEREENR